MALGCTFRNGEEEHYVNKTLPIWVNEFVSMACDCMLFPRRGKTEYLFFRKLYEGVLELKLILMILVHNDNCKYLHFNGVNISPVN